MNNKLGFTLVEVLITLVIIGVVAALTIPALINQINSRLETRQTQVIEKKFVEGLNLFNIQENGLANDYATTYDFLKGLSAHYKMSSICDPAHIGDCFPYGKINIAGDSGDDTIDVSSITSAKSLNLNDDFLPPAAFISAAGTPFIVSFNSKCGELDSNSIDPDIEMKHISPCVAGIYDLNGTRVPNRFGAVYDDAGDLVSGGKNDIKSFNGARLTGCLAKVDGVCFECLQRAWQS